MTYFMQQKGSSTTGLLTASAILIGLLVYANQYAFKTDNPDLVKTTKQDDTQAALPLIMEKDNAVIQPSPQGIFQAATITETELGNSDQLEEKLIQAKANIENEPVNVSSEQLSAIPEHQQANFTYAYYQGAYPGADQLAMRYWDNHAATHVQYQRYYANGLGNGRGQGRGRMDGDGEFNFSMNFKTRARFDADTSLDSDIYADGFQQTSFYQDAAIHPYYGYNYYQY